MNIETIKKGAFSGQQRSKNKQLQAIIDQGLYVQQIHNWEVRAVIDKPMDEDINFDVLPPVRDRIEYDNFTVYFFAITEM